MFMHMYHVTLTITLISYSANNCAKQIIEGHVNTNTLHSNRLGFTNTCNNKIGYLYCTANKGHLHTPIGHYNKLELTIYD